MGCLFLVTSAHVWIYNCPLISNSTAETRQDINTGLCQGPGGNKRERNSYCTSQGGFQGLVYSASPVWSPSLTPTAVQQRRFWTPSWTPSTSGIKTAAQRMMGVSSSTWECSPLCGKYSLTPKARTEESLSPNKTAAPQKAPAIPAL